MSYRMRQTGGRGAFTVYIPLTLAVIVGMRLLLAGFVTMAWLCMAVGFVASAAVETITREPP